MKQTRSFGWVLAGVLAGCVIVSGCMSPRPAAAAAERSGALVSAPAPVEADIPGARRFVFDRWSGPPLPVWYLRPAATPATAPVVFVMHGVKRDADRYLSAWVATARRHGFIVVVPEFTAQAFPGAPGYNFGGTFAKGGKELPRERWSYSAIEPIFDAVREVEGLSASQYWLFGHSAGAQFVHRYAMLGLGGRMRGAISANAGSYMLASKDVRWPFGVAGAPGGEFSFTRAFAAPMIVLLGDADVDPAHPSLPHQPEADAQGAHRFARGLKFYNGARSEAQRDNLPFAWSCVIAPGVAHENGKMAEFAAQLITAAAPPPGTDCAAAPVPQ